MNPQVFESQGIAGAYLVQIAADVENVERELSKLVRSDVEVVEKVGRLTLEAGGKRLRPAFLILSARSTALEFSLDRAIHLGACMELIHMATLIHDDVIDMADSRRGKPTASFLYGNTASILSGDALLARAMQILAIDGDLRIIKAAADMVVQMAEGEAREVEVRNDFSLSETQYFDILHKKTAAFVECCCHIGGLVARAEEPQVEALRSYGANLGIAFQIVDDLLDYRGDSAKTGKPIATDFTEGCMTLPLIHLRENGTKTQIARVESQFSKEVTPEETREIVQILTEAGSFAYAERKADEYLDRAISALADLPDTAHRDLLRASLHFVVSRSQ